MKYIYKYKYIILFLIIGLMVLGVLYTVQIPKQEMPTLQTPYFIVTATKVNENDDSLDTVLEDWINHEDIVNIKTIKYPTSTLIIAEFSYDTADPDVLKENILNDLTISLPNYLIVEKEVIASYDLIFAVSGDVNNLNSVANLLVEKLKTLPTENSQISLPYSEEYSITFNPGELVSNDISLEDLSMIIYQINQETTTNLDDYKSIHIKEGVTLSDIAEIELNSDPNSFYNDEEAIFVQSSFQTNVDYTKYIDDLENIIDTINQENITTTVTPIVMTPKDVDTLFSDLLESIGLAIFIVFMVSLLGLGFKQSLIVVAIVPTTIFITILALYFLDFELHKLTVIGLILSIGMMVDNAIVLTEGTKTNIELGYTSKEAATLAVKKNKWPILTATLTTLIAFSSIVFIPGFVGDLIKSMPISVIIAIGSSYCLSLVLTPILASMFIKTGKHGTTDNRFFENILSNTLRHSKKILLFICFVIILITTYSLWNVDINLFPSDEKNDFYINVSSNNEKDLSNAVNTLYSNLLEYSEIEGISISINQDLPRFHLSAKALPYDQYAARLYINYNDSDEKMMALISSINTWEIENVTFCASSMFLSPPDSPLEVVLTGANASEVALNIYNLLQSNSMVESIQTTYNQTLTVPIVIPISSYNETDLGLINALVFGQLNEIDISGISIQYSLDTNESLYNLKLNNTSYFFESYQLGLQTIPYSIHNYNLEDSAYLSITPYKNKDISELKSIIDENISSNIDIHYSGENDLFTTLSKSLIISASIAILLMFLLLWYQFKKIAYPLIILVTVPLSFTGSLLGMKLFNYDVTISSLIGMVSLLGVTINIGILLLEEIVSKMEIHTIKNACISGTTNRLRPILLTSSTTIFGLIPLYLSGGDFFKPLAITFIFGMIFATLISLFIIPIIVYIFKKE